MSLDRLNYLNIGLMILSAGLAIYLPFEVFLFSYAVLGPLHYATELNWLHQRDYFMVRKGEFWILVGLCAVAFLIYLSNFLSKLDITLTPDHRTLLATRYNLLIVLTFVLAGALTFVQNRSWRVAVLAAAVVLILFANVSHPSLVLLAVFLPTVLHVWFFTGVFILAGALKSNSRSGYLSFAIYLACSVIFFLFHRETDTYAISEYVQQSYQSTNFGFVNAQIFEMLGKPGLRSFALNTPVGLGIQSFIAFAYTYHYLNWFSKTGLIKWHRVPKGRLVGALALWVGAVGLYAYNYQLGLGALFFLSLLHVFMEFPLNYHSMVEVGRSLRARISNRAGGVTKKSTVQVKKLEKY